MKETLVRLSKIHIQNFKNVVDGVLDFSIEKDIKKSNLLGLYGQNGSGKTALIDALLLLKSALCGQPINSQYVDYINVNCLESQLTYTLLIKDIEDREYYVDYSFDLKKIKNENSLSNTGTPADSVSKAVICNEKISYSVKSDGKTIVRYFTLIDSAPEELPFISSSEKKTIALIGNSKDVYMDLLVTKKVTRAMSRSFLFSAEFLNLLNKSCKVKEYLSILNNLVHYGNCNLFVFDTASNAIISFNALPISFNIKNENHGAFGNIVIPFAGNGLIPEEAWGIVEKIINNMNIVLNQLVPGLTIQAKILGQEYLPDTKIGYRVQLLSSKNDKTIPLCYESEGIKKIVAILQLLILVYNKPSVTIAIDELDSGIFEYLLGELLRIIANTGKGQLIFTSHNLRPLETINKSFIAFTTTNPNNRYIRMTNVKTTNNLRNFYYRDITLGEQSEQVYEATNNYEIALAFKEAGEGCGS